MYLRNPELILQPTSMACRLMPDGEGSSNTPDQGPQADLTITIAGLIWSRS
jgi:hypothetical protein